MNAEAPIEEFKAIAHPVRFRILTALVGAERNVGEIEEVAEIGQPSLSQQLAVLRNAGLVETRKDAKLVYYRLNQQRISALMASLSNLTDETAQHAPARRSSSPGTANFARLS